MEISKQDPKGIPGIRFEAIKPDHASRVLQYLATLHEERLLTLNRMKKLPSEQREREWLQKFDGGKGYGVAAFDGDRIIGFLHAEILEPQEMSVNCEFGLSVLAEYRRRGIGSNLIRQAEDWAWGKGVWRMELGVYSNNADGILLYQRLGYREDGRRVDAVKLWNGDRADVIHMYKFLNQPA